ncbi:MAG: hypothetical protein IT536_03735 [Hyphomicrobiales bacterium]|nr:hypothetical protein [Hyphomicrobiales bacterium]
MSERDRNLTGVWNGLYSYSSGLSVSFVATLIESGSALSGATHEPNVLGTNPGATLTALLSGARRNGAVSFIKTYDDSGPRPYHPVSYDGALNADATEIEGRWRIGDGTTGRFLMVRAQANTAAVKRSKRAKV